MTTIADQQEKRLRRTKVRKVSEADTLKAVLALCAYHPKVEKAWRQQVGTFLAMGPGGKPRMHRGKYVYVKVGEKGMSDIGGYMKNGLVLAIETKSTIGTATDDQLIYIHNVQRCGGFAGFARTADDAREIIEGRALRVAAPAFRLSVDSLR